MPQDTATPTERWSDLEVLERLTNAASALADAAQANGHRWSCLYETQALVHGIRTMILDGKTYLTER